MAQLDDMLLRLQGRIPADTQYPFSPSDLKQYIFDALNQHAPEYTTETLPESEEYLVVWLALISVYMTLAARYAEDFDIKVTGGDFKMQQPHIHYMNMAKSILDQYNTNTGSKITVSTVTRVSTRTGRKTEFYPGDIQ